MLPYPRSPCLRVQASREAGPVNRSKTMLSLATVSWKNLSMRTSLGVLSRVTEREVNDMTASLVLLAEAPDNENEAEQNRQRNSSCRFPIAENVQAMLQFMGAAPYPQGGVTLGYQSGP